ncbi:MAG: glycosyltransferase [Coriobacteriia bacterium]|nr:glycosyltransferase [Coriobacteriia bacterium]
MTLASTSFISNVASGLIENGHRVKVIVMGKPAVCIGDSMPGLEVTSLFDNVPGPKLLDVTSAKRLGIAVSADYSVSKQSWFAELLLYKKLQTMKGQSNENGLILCYSRSDATMGVASNVAGLIGWSLGAFATEALTDNQINPLTREHYIDLVRTKTDFLWATSHYLQKYWTNYGYPSDRIFMNYSVVDCRNFELVHKSSYVVDGVFTGNLGSRYIAELLRVIDIAKRKKPDIVVEAYGDALAGDVATLSDKIRCMGLQGSVILKPSVPPAKIPEILASGRLLLAPVSEENRAGHMAPHKIAEYFAAGGLVIASDVGDLSEMFESGEDCFLAKSTEEFAAMVVNALNLSDEQRHVIGERGREHAAYYMDAKVVTERLLRFQGPLTQRDRARKGRGASLVDVLKWYKDYRKKADKPMISSVLWFKRAVVTLLRKLKLKKPLQ